jgi:hypothetical protein
LQRGLSQAELALRAGLTPDYLLRWSLGGGGATPRWPGSWPRSWRSTCENCGPRATPPRRPARAAPTPNRPRVAYRRVHPAYLRILLVRAVRSAYAAMEEWEIERHCEGIPWEGVVGVVRARKREVGPSGN